MSLSVPSAQSASTATMIPTITAFHIAVASELNPSTHGEITSHTPSTTLTHSSHAITLNSAISAAAAIRIPRITAFEIAAFEITAFNVKCVSVWYCSAQGDTIIQMP